MVEIVKPSPLLPFRPGAAFTPCTLVSNFYVPAFHNGTAIHVYTVSFTPEVESGNRMLRWKLVDSVKAELKSLVGGYVLSGLNLFAIKEQSEGHILACTSQGQTFSLRLAFSHSVPLADITGRRDVSLVLNVILKKMLRELGLLQVTRMPKFFDPNGTVPIPSLSLEVWRGYSAELNFYCRQPLVTIDFSSKIVHTRSLLDELRDMQTRDRDWLSLAKCELIDRVVMTQYGNRRCYRISDICPDLTPLSSFEKDGSDITYADYFAKQYGVTIVQETQPLILSKVRRKLEEREVYLVPELVTLTGLDESMRRHYESMKKIAAFTCIDPKARFAASERLASHLNDNSKSCAVSSEFRFSISREPLTVQGSRMAEEQVYFQGRSSAAIGTSGAFAVPSCIQQPVTLDNWLLFASDKDQDTAKDFACKLHAKLRDMQISIRDAKIKNYNWSTFQQTLETEAPVQIAVILLRRAYHKRDYERIKTLTTTETPVLTQVVTLPLRGKDDKSIISSIALQIQAKLGAQLWTVSPTRIFGEYLMVVGIDVFHDTVQRGKSVLGFCATISADLCKYFSTTTLHNTGQEVSSCLGVLFARALEVYRVHFRRYPETVIFFRDGVAESQMKAVYDFEVQSVLSVCRQVTTPPRYRPRIIFTVVVKRTSAKFYNGSLTAKEKLQNPLPGTVIFDSVVPAAGDFYLISHKAKQGIATPTLYRRLFTTHECNFPMESFVSLTYRLCHMYYNYSGGVKVPAPCMMAHKLAYFVGKSTHVTGEMLMSTSPYFL